MGICIGPRIKTEKGLYQVYPGQIATCFIVYGRGGTLGVFDTVTEARAFARAIAAFEGAGVDDYAWSYK